MKATPDPEYAAWLLAQARERHPNDYHANPGLIHVSELITCLAQAYYKRVVGVPARIQPAEDLTFMVGSAFHAWLEFEPEKPIILEGMIGRPDMHDGEIPAELKTTRLSASHDPLDLGSYIDQIAAYAVMEDQLSARLTVLHLNGDYGEDRAPMLRSWLLSWTQEELDQWALKLAGRRSILQTALETETPPDTKYRRKGGVCSLCPFYKRICNPRNRATWGPNFSLDEEPGLDYAEAPVGTGGEE